MKTRLLVAKTRTGMSAQHSAAHHRGAAVRSHTQRLPKGFAKNALLIGVVGSAMFWAPTASAREVVVLNGVVGPTGVLTGVDTQGPGTLTVGAQDINTSNDAGGGITSDAANTANVLFNNSSVVTGFVGTTGTTFLNVTAGAVGSIVTFSGPVFATTFTLAGTGTVNFNGGFTSNTGSTMDFAGDGFINVGAGQTVLAAITNSAGAQTGTLTLNANSILDGAVGAASGLKQVTVAGGNALITGQVNSGIYTLGTNTLNVAGAFAIPVAGTIHTTIFSALDYGQIVPVGAATIGTGMVVNVTVTGPIANGTIFNIVDATSGTNGSVVNVTSNTASYAFTAAPTTAGLVQITTIQIPLDVVVLPVDDPVAPIIAPIIEVLPPDPIVTAIEMLPTPEAVAAALAQLVPDASQLHSPLEVFRTTQRFQSILFSHLECGDESQPDDRKRPRRDREDETGLCQPDDMRAHFWATEVGYFGEQDDQVGHEGYDLRTVGGMLALDVPLGDAAHTGVALTFARTSLDDNHFDGQSDADSYQATAFLSYAPNNWFLRGALTWGIDDYSGSRHIFFPGVDLTANADYSGDQFTARAATGYHFYVGDGLTVITPTATLQYTDLHVDGYTEDGAGIVDLIVNKRDYEFLQSGLGVKIARDILFEQGEIMRPELHANWLHSFDDEIMSETAAFTGGGPAFTITGLSTGENMYDIGAGVTLADSGPWSLEAVYDYQWQSEGYTVQQAMVTLALRL